MAYKSLYRKYRPTTFNSVIGQENVVKVLKNAIIKEKISHSYLFAGPKGTGKTSVAKIFAKAINCETPVDGESCKKCNTCKMIEDDSSLDIIEIDAASNNGVDEIRTLKENINYAPSFAKYKVYIVDEVHMLSNSAFNALLKTLEEPPAHAVLIFATTEPHKIPATIISRCQRYDFKNLTKTELVSVISKALKNENIPFESEAIKKIAYLANGGARDALSISDQLINYSQGKINSKDIDTVFGLVNNNKKIHFINLIGTKNAKNVLDEVETIINSGADLVKFMESLLICMKDALLTKQVKTDEYNDLLSLEDANNILVAPKDLISLIHAFIPAVEKIKTSTDPRFYFQVSCIEAINMIDMLIQEVDIQPANEPVAHEELIISAPIQEQEIDWEDSFEEESEITDDIQEDYSDEVNVDVEDEFRIELSTAHNMKKSQEIDLSTVKDYADKSIQETTEISTSGLNLFNSTEKTIEMKQLKEMKPIAKEEVKQIAKEVETQINKLVQSEEEQIATLINMLHQADRKITLERAKKWPVLNEYILDNKWSKYAGVLADSKIIIATETSIALYCDLPTVAKNINAVADKDGFKEFINLIFDEYLFVFATYPKQLMDTKTKYLKLQSENNLPAITPINRPALKKQKTSLLDMGKDIFGDDIQIID